ncbi:MAG: ABC transporter permease [Blautia sp.]|nr:ABC transporter permease [Blautia sp.]
MGKLFYIARSNLRKKKGEGRTVFFMIALSALLLYTAVSVFTGMSHVLEDCYSRAHSADLIYICEKSPEKIGELFRAQEEVLEYESATVYNVNGGEYHREGAESLQIGFLIGSFEEERKMNLLAGYDGRPLTGNEILLPYYLETAEGFSEGDAFYLKLGQREYTFTVAGFVENPLMGTPMNISYFYVYVSQAQFESLARENPTVAAGTSTEHKVRLTEGESSYAFDQKISMLLTREVPEVLDSPLSVGLNREMMSGGIAMMSRICMGIILAFSVLLIAVALIVIRFSIRNFMELNLKNTGILKAAGYSGWQLTGAVVLEMGLVSVPAIIVGTLLGMAGSGVIAAMQGRLMGIRWQQRPDFAAAAVTAALILFIVLFTSAACGGCYRKITVLEALRGGIHTHNFKKNYFSFESCRLPRSLVFAGKNIMQEKGKNLSVCLITLLLSFVTCVGLGLYENFALHTDTLLKLTGIEAGDVVVIGENVEEIEAELESWEEVKQVVCYTAVSATLESGTASDELNCEVWDELDALQNKMVLEGRFPRYENEIMLTTVVASALDVQTGDTIYVTGAKERLPYLVSGITQQMTEMGMRAILSGEGSLRLNGENRYQVLYLYTEGISFEEMSDRILAEYPTLSVTDSRKQTDSILKTTVDAMVAICLIFVTVTVLVVIMVEQLLVKSCLIRERKNYGIHKAVGFTSAELIRQTILLHMPAVVVGAAVGTVAGILFFNPLIALFLAFCGITKCGLVVPLHWLLFTVAGIVGVALVSSLLSALRIRKIVPARLLTEE